MLEECVIAGFGGQGILSAGMILAHAAMHQGLEVAWIPSYGPEMRGGTANCTVILSDEQVGSPSTAHPTGVIAMNAPSFERFEPIVRAGGTLVVNTSLVADRSGRGDITVLYIPAADLALEAGSALVASVVALGAFNTARGLVHLDRIAAAIAWTLPERRRDLLSVNLEALLAGEAVARAHREAARPGRQAGSTTDGEAHAGSVVAQSDSGPGAPK